jgi:glucose-1-phosphate thymidylyltransferase
VTAPDWPEHRGILLAGGRGTRLYPLTATASKQLTAVYNKPMVYYPLSTLMMSGVREVLVISTPEDLPRYRSLLGDGSSIGISITYAQQDKPRGIAEALIIGESFLEDRPSILILGDNLIYGRLDFLRDALRRQSGDAIVFGYQVSNPSEYGVIEFNSSGRAIGIEEKPQNPQSNWAVPGLYVYPAGVATIARSIDPSDRGELEITELNRNFLERERLQVVPMGRGIAWFDTGTPKALLEAANFIEAIERRQGLIIGSPEEVAYRMGYLDREGLARCAAEMPVSEYRSYLENLLDSPHHFTGASGE